MKKGCHGEKKMGGGDKCENSSPLLSLPVDCLNGGACNADAHVNSISCFSFQGGVLGC